MNKPYRNNRMIMVLAACVALMVGLAYASVPLYTLFCKATGFGGTTQRANSPVPPSAELAHTRTITVSFDGNVDPSLPWDFAPEQREVQVKLGETTHITYRAHNRSAKTITGTAVYNVQPDKAGLYFNKIQCFCFTKQTLKAKQTEEMPVEFYIDPSLADSRNADDITHITLSYTFYAAKKRGG